MTNKNGTSAVTLGNVTATYPSYATLVPEDKPVFDRVADKLVQKDVDARTASVAAVKPVTHTLLIQAVK